MILEETQRLEILSRIGRVETALFVLCGLIVLQIIAKVFLFSWIVIVLRRVKDVLARVEALLGIVERHAELSEKQQARMAEATASTAVRVEKALEIAPDKIIDRLKTEANAGAVEAKEVKRVLDARTEKNDAKLDTIHALVNSEVLELKRKHADKCHRHAADVRTPENIEEAREADAEYEAHRIKTVEMGEGKGTGDAVTISELNKNVLETPAKTADEMEKRQQSPPEKAP